MSNKGSNYSAGSTAIASVDNLIESFHGPFLIRNALFALCRAFDDRIDGRIGKAQHNNPSFSANIALGRLMKYYEITGFEELFSSDLLPGYSFENNTIIDIAKYAAYVEQVAAGICVNSKKTKSQKHNERQREKKKRNKAKCAELAERKELARLDACPHDKWAPYKSVVDNDY